MKRILAVLCVLGLTLGAPVGTKAAACPSIDRFIGLRYLGKQQLTVDATARSLTLPSGTVRWAIVQVEGDAIRYWDGTDVPTATVGVKVPVDGIVDLCGLSVAGFRAIRVTTDATLHILYYGE